MSEKDADVRQEEMICIGSWYLVFFKPRWRIWLKHPIIQEASYPVSNHPRYALVSELYRCHDLSSHPVVLKTNSFYHSIKINLIFRF